ncbi:baseplate assembly protein [Pseudoalteromonas denitrificans]|jgi:phage-related baseplate assembly protein|uniref:Phage-related baseplate assembly protein n=1 Tax=Pseudoalteromonas denitrificans DSM 6059 TaxID=1123010 RepID=A0A1I1Q2F1_9GAMM|nr:baseplate J/gp47 family protein [Pseudoalteromonas denitrificans]SFD14038.1 Phage-related baseplate assembly protein [Pseudoalteromonas denitrificans DSM 6059]
MNTPIDLTQLFAPDIVEALDYETIFDEMLQALQNKTDQFNTLIESDPAFKILEVAAYRELLLRQRVNDASKSVMLAYATGNDLDNLAALFGVKRQCISDSESDELIMESDTRFRMRIPLSLEGHSTAGPVGAYKFHTLSASVDVKDVSVATPEPGKVLVTVLANTQTGLPSQALLNQILQRLNDEDIRPLTDWVNVQAAHIINYQIEANIELNSGPGKTQTLDNVNLKVNEFIQQAHQLGNEITVSGLYAAMHQVGVKKVKLLQPVSDIQVTTEQAAYCNDIKINTVQ